MTELRTKGLTHKEIALLLKMVENDRVEPTEMTSEKAILFMEEHEAARAMPDTRLWDKLEETKHLPRDERIRLMTELIEQIRKERSGKVLQTMRENLWGLQREDLEKLKLELDERLTYLDESTDEHISPTQTDDELRDNERLPNSKEIFESLFSDLYENKVIYHERVTMLCEVIRYEVTEEDFEVWLNWIKPLYLGDFHPEYLDTHEEIHVGAAFVVGNGDFSLYDGHRIGRAYCPFSLWTEKGLVETVAKMSAEELEANLSNLLWKRK